MGPGIFSGLFISIQSLLPCWKKFSWFQKKSFNSILLNSYEFYSRTIFIVLNQMEIINNNFNLNIYGFSGIAVNKDYIGTAFKLMDKMWKAVKSNNLKNKGLNVFVYEEYEKVFSGVELYTAPEQSIGLEQKNITLNKYAYYKHIGPYQLIKQTGQNMRELKNKGLETCLPYIEIYGHWTKDESRLETELIMCLR